MARIAIFDSGVGGLSIYKEVCERLPNHEFVFVSDNECYPYGDKDEDFLIQRVLQLSMSIVEQCAPDIFVVACNTASTIVLPALRANLNIPIVGVVPAIKPAARLSKTKNIGLLATPGTINRKYTDELIAEFAADCSVSKVGSSKLVELAEQKLRGKQLEIDTLEAELKPLLDIKEIDTLVLACTHFPLLNNEIADIFKAYDHPITQVDSGAGIASRVGALVDKTSLTNPPQSADPVRNQAFFTTNIDTESFFIKQLEIMNLAYQGELPKVTKGNSE